jgi:hypothetical protein
MVLFDQDKDNTLMDNEDQIVLPVVVHKNKHWSIFYANACFILRNFFVFRVYVY